MSGSSKIISVKYVFLDVVAYTNRTIEAQCYVIDALNRIVKGAIKRYHINDSLVIYVPTGDGMCIALLGTDLAYDIHVTIAKEILRRILANNSKVKDEWKKFAVRVGINQCADNIVTDVNGNRNVAGAGINNARRIMDLADASQILVSSTVYEDLHPRKKYYNAFSHEFSEKVKHGLILKMYQLIRPDTGVLNVDTPSSLLRAPQPEPKLPRLTAYYFAHSIKNEDFILTKAREIGLPTETLKLLLWFLARDSEEKASRSPHNIYTSSFMPHGCPAIIEEQFEWFCEKFSDDVALRLSRLTLNNAVPSPMQYDYFEEMTGDLVINSEGKAKLKKEYPEIWDEFKLGEL